VFCWLVQGPASRNENSGPNLSLDETQTQVNGHFANTEIARSRAGAQTNAQQPKKWTWQERFRLAVQIF